MTEKSVGEWIDWPTSEGVWWIKSADPLLAETIGAPEVCRVVRESALAPLGIRVYRIGGGDYIVRRDWASTFQFQRAVIQEPRT